VLPLWRSSALQTMYPTGTGVKARETTTGRCMKAIDIWSFPDWRTRSESGAPGITPRPFFFFANDRHLKGAEEVGFKVP
jgi:hypothetical protein